MYCRLVADTYLQGVGKSPSLFSNPHQFLQKPSADSMTSKLSFYCHIGDLCFLKALVAAAVSCDLTLQLCNQKQGMIIGNALFKGFP